ncbi:retrovirus-related pol polyprotein from transposon TNT 1-94 [Tanacetum coccineum]
MKIIKGALVLMKGEKVAANLYQLKGDIIKEAKASVASHSPSHRVAVSWHQKLGHMSEQGMKILVERNLIHGLTKVSLPFYEYCVISKQHRLKFKTSNSRSVYVLELVHSDVWQAPVYSIKKKSDVFEVFKVYKARVKLDSGKKIKCLRMDNGCEYTGDEFDTFCRQEGIKRQFTTAYTPQQNGVAKRMNRTLLERARAILATTSLRKSFWAEAINTTCYVINRSPSTIIELKTPTEMWTGKPVNYSDLHIFGSPVYVMYNTQETTKLDPKSRKCLFLGYIDRVKGYRLWDPTAHKVVVNRDVVFMEDKIQENEEGDNTTWETTSIQIEKEFQSNDSLKAVPQHEVYKIKRNGDDQVEWYRARLVVKGNDQKKGTDFNKKNSPVVRMTTIRVVLAMCATYDLHLEQLDVKIVFLHGNLEKKFTCSNQKVLNKKEKRTWFAGPNKDRINKLKAQLAREFKMKDLGPANKILGMQIHRCRVSRKIWLSQKSYVKKILQRFNMQYCKPISTLFPTDVKLSSKMSSSSEKERIEISQVPYASAVGSLMFAMIYTRPNIAHAVGVVSRYMAEPGRQHWEAKKRILRYIKGTSDVALCFRDSDLIVKGYVDSDYACDLDGSKSTTGYVFTLSGGTVSWVSKLQSVVAMSTTEAKYVAAAQASKEAVWLKMLLEELRHKKEKITLFCDNQSALYLARNLSFHSKTKHIRVMEKENAFLVNDVEAGLCVDNTDAEIVGRCYNGSNQDKGKELWDSLESKYMSEDASSKKFLVSNFNNYKMVDSRPVMEQYNELLRILGQYTHHGLKMDESISISSIIDKFPPSWKGFKHTLKHGKDDLSLVQLGSHLRIEKSLRA